MKGDDIYDKPGEPGPVTLLLIGKSGTGKTYNATRIAPRGTVVFNFDRNIRNVPADIRGIITPGNNTKSALIWENFVGQLKTVAADPGVKVIVIDSLTTLALTIIWKIKKGDNADDTMVWDDWHIFTRHLQWLAGRLLAAQDLDKHIIFLAHEEPVKDSKGNEKEIRLLVGSNLKNSYGLYFDNVWRCYRNGSDYNVDTCGGVIFSGKCSFDLPEKRLNWDEHRGLITDAFNSAMTLTDKNKEQEQKQEQDKGKQ